MKRVIFSILCVSLIFSCGKEKDLETGLHEVELRGGNTVDICHVTGNGSWHVISVNENALAAHLAHGDVLLEDNDGDGYVANENECVPGGDCDDNDPDVNPGSEEQCDNNIDDNCDGEVNEDCCPYWTLDEILDGGYSLWFDYRDQDCLINSVGFYGGACIFGYADGSIFAPLDCGLFVAWDESLKEPCDQILLQAQEILMLDLWCDQNTMEETSLFESVTQE